MGLPILAMVVGLSMIVGAVGLVRLSNIVSNDNQIGLPVAIEIQATNGTPGGNLPDYASGFLTQGQTYDMLVTYTTTKALTSAAVIVEFTKTGINTTDVLMSWTVSGPTWTGIEWTDNGDVLRGTLGAVGSQGIGTVNHYASLAYVVGGDFNFKMWVEGSV